MPLAVTANPIPGMSDAYAACKARGRNTRAPWLWDGLVGLWLPSVGIQGGRLLDWSGYHNHGTLTNMDPATDWVTTPYGWGLDFDGGNDYVNVSGVTSSSQTYTFGMLVRSSAAASTNRYLFDCQTGRFVLAWFGPTSGQIGFYDGAWRHFGVNAPNDGAWHHLAFVFNNAASLASLYIDGGEVGTSQLYAGKLIGGNVAIASKHDGSGNWLRGAIAHFPLWSRALTPAEIRALAADPGLMIRPQMPVFMSPVELVVPPAARPGVTVPSLGVGDDAISLGVGDSDITLEVGDSSIELEP